MQLDQFVILFVLLLLSGFFSSAETALFSISKAKAIHLAKQKGTTNKLIKKMKADPHRLLSTILIGNNLVNVGASAIATAITIDLFESHAVGIATGVMTFLILIFGEIFPKSIATRNNVLIARLVIFPLYWLSILFTPLIIFLNFIPKLTEDAIEAATVDEIQPIAGDEALPPSLYRLFVCAGSPGVRDLAGDPLDGDDRGQRHDHDRVPVAHHPPMP